MVSAGLLMSMVFALMATFMVPVVVLMWLLIKKRAKSVLFLFLIGIMSFFAGHIALFLPFDFLIYSKEKFTKFTLDYLYIASAISAINFAVSVIVAIVVFLYILKPGGITFNRMIAYAMGFFGMYNMYGFGLKYISNFTILESIQNDTLAKKYPNVSEEGLAAMKKLVTDVSPFQYISEGLRHIMFLIIGIAVTLTLVYGIIQKKIVPSALKMLGYISGCSYLFSVISHYIHPGATIPFVVVASIPAILIINKFAKNPKDVMIKPEAMQML